MAWSFDRRPAPVALTDRDQILALADRQEDAGYIDTAATMRWMAGQIWPDQSKAK